LKAIVLSNDLLIVESALSLNGLKRDVGTQVAKEMKEEGGAQGDGRDESEALFSVSDRLISGKRSNGEAEAGVTAQRRRRQRRR